MDFWRTMKPYQQGYLDGFCGVYSIVNAARIIKGWNEDQCLELYEKILIYLTKNKTLIPSLLYGIDVNLIGSLFRYVVKDTLQRQMPFKRRKKVPTDEFWNYMMEYMSNGNKRVILLCLEGKHHHWTLVKDITDKRIRLFDSNSLQTLNRMRCTTSTVITKTRLHRIVPTMTYFLS
jgi:hypothetical protein